MSFAKCMPAKLHNVCSTFISSMYVWRSPDTYGSKKNDGLTADSDSYWRHGNSVR